MVQTNPTTADDTLHLPRILCLHGGGSNAAVFQSQCRRLIAQLKSEFRFVFAQAPFLSEAGPDVMSVYSQWGPFRRWLRWSPDHPELRPQYAIRVLDDSLEEAKRQDDAKGATGAWVGLLGFSQGAKMCASILYRQQVRQEQLGRRSGDSEYDFGILIAGRAPFVCLDPHLDLHSPLPDVSQITDGKYEGPCPNVLRIPTVHVHGIRDPHVALHRQLFSDFSSAESRRFVEWDGGHRVPLKYNDVSLVAYQIRELAIQAGLR
ncbi:Serine hydrolase FSH [Penicillium manginii]|jgi:predicted esterase|uniref:Serine hydrolase FSH n=1 Tax=Penicillium manginii TaxID=203109 RepID=UPI00254791A3|nr:Serine hydrolase FSH [Penicillium manginii]KAJ5744671.1 Serine hydrolase FSH [Penicillium manginii]